MRADARRFVEPMGNTGENLPMGVVHQQADLRRAEVIRLLYGHA